MSDDIELILWMKTGATPEQVALVDSQLAGSTNVHSHRFISEAETYAEFEEFWTDSPEVLDTVRPEDLPTSFRIALVEIPRTRGEVATFAQKFDISDGVLRADFPGSSDGRMMLFIDPEATHEQTRRTESYLSGDSTIVGYEIFDADETDADFEDFLANRASQEKLDSIDPASRPTSIRLDHIPDFNPSGQIQFLSTLPGVLAADWNPTC